MSDNLSDSRRIEQFLTLSKAELADTLAGGCPVAPAALDDSRYLGISLGMPGVIDRLLWKTFEKTFHRDPKTGALRGWNVRLEQTGWEDAPVPKVKGGAPVTFGHYAVTTPAAPHRAPAGSLLLDYSVGNPALDPTRLVRDPVVALEAGEAGWLLGWTWLAFPGARVGTPSYFLLKRVGPLEYIPG